MKVSVKVQVHPGPLLEALIGFVNLFSGRASPTVLIM
jgi:hypothetical protein